MTKAPRPTWTPLPLRCDCGHEWQDWMPSGAKLAVAIAAMDALRCPKCGNGPGAFHIIPGSDFDGLMPVVMTTGKRPHSEGAADG